MSWLCPSASDVIALVAILIAIVTTVIQAVYERRREWHAACELLFQSMDSLYTEVKELVATPDKTNHTSYQHCLNHRMNLLDHYSKRFILQRKRVKRVRDIITNTLVEVPANAEYEELINKGFESQERQNNTLFFFINEIRAYIAEASKALIK